MREEDNRDRRGILRRLETLNPQDVVHAARTFQRPDASMETRTAMEAWIRTGDTAEHARVC